MLMSKGIERTPLLPSLSKKPLKQLDQEPQELGFWTPPLQNHGFYIRWLAAIPCESAAREIVKPEARFSWRFGKGETGGFD